MPNFKLPTPDMADLLHGLPHGSSWRAPCQARMLVGSTLLLSASPEELLNHVSAIRLQNPAGYGQAVVQTRDFVASNT